MFRGVHHYNTIALSMLRERMAPLARDSAHNAPFHGNGRHQPTLFILLRDVSPHRRGVLAQEHIRSWQPTLLGPAFFSFLFSIHFSFFL
jgi:hypothetical protein